MRVPQREKPHLIKPDQTSNTHHSGDGSDRNVDSENAGEDDEDYSENHEDHTPIHTDDIYFATNSSTDTDKTISTTTDDEDSQLIFYLFLFDILLCFLSYFSLTNNWLDFGSHFLSFSLFFPFVFYFLQKKGIFILSQKNSLHTNTFLSLCFIFCLLILNDDMKSSSRIIDFLLYFFLFNIFLSFRSKSIHKLLYVYELLLLRARYSL